MTSPRGVGRSRLIAVTLVLLPWAAIGAGAKEPVLGGRRPQWPLKTSRILLTDEQIARARKLCQTDEGAVALLKQTVEQAEYWTAKADEQLHQLLPDGRVPRAFNVSTGGCPVHGKDIYKHGTYPWKLDRERPFTIICPVGGERYPSNDFEAYYRSGMKDESLLTGPYADPGRGWVSPGGEKYWLVGYACHWNWQKTWLPAVTTLSQAYVLTGDRLYARKAIVMLDRIAEIYPGLDYSKQSRYAELVGGRYHAKIVNAIWETGVLRRLAVAYDLVFDALVGEGAISLPWRTAEQIRANIEANLLEEGVEAVGRGQIQGNFGMHQSALAYTVVVRQNGPTAGLLDGIFTSTGGSHSQEGLNYALYNLVFKDGMPFESSPNYCFSWVSNFVKVADAVSRSGIDLYEHPKMRLMFDAPLELICAGKFTPAIGDAGSIRAGWIGPQLDTYEAAYRHLPEPRYAWAIDRLGGLKSDRIGSFDDLFKQSIFDKAKADAQDYRRRPASRLLDGYGLAVLNNANDSIAVSMYYGIRGGHGHSDRLNLELFARGRRLSPDLGYPDFMNTFWPGIASWSKNTVSHNCLVLDDRRQLGNQAGKVLRFHDSPTVDVVDVDGGGSYGQADVYRRTLVLVEVGEDDAYLVDVFRVRGGTSHVLSIHGQEGEFELAGITLPAPVTEGTLAGRDVAYGRLYDDPQRSKPEYKGGFYGYSGSGYQHLFNWQRATPDEMVIGTWKLKDTPAARLRVHVPPRPEQELIVADAYVSPTRKIPTVLKYMLLRRSGAESSSTFATVWEPAGDEPLIDRIEVHTGASLGTGHNRLVTLSVHRGETTDVIAVAPEAGREYEFGAGLTTDAAVVVVSEQRGRRVRTFAAGGSNLTGKQPTEKVTIPAAVSGEIRTVDYAEKRILVKVAGPPPQAAMLRGLMVRIFNENHSCMYAIASAQVTGDMLGIDLAGSDVFTGRIRIQSVDPAAKTVFTPTAVLYPFNLSGMHLVTEDLKHAALIASMDKGVIQLGENAQLEPFAAGLDTPGPKDAWIADFGAGAEIEIERFVHQPAG